MYITGGASVEFSQFTFYSRSNLRTELKPGDSVWIRSLSKHKFAVSFMRGFERLYFHDGMGFSDEIHFSCKSCALPLSKIWQNFPKLKKTVLSHSSSGTEILFSKTREKPVRA